MKTAWCVLLAGVLAIAAIGCAQDRMACPPARCGMARGGCQGPGILSGCKVRGCDGIGGLHARARASGPSMGAVEYPYYSLRGPRDFLATNPQPIGP